MPIAKDELLYIPDFLSLQKSSQLMTSFEKTLPWKQDKIRIFGKWVEIPRLQCWYGDSEAAYTYSGLSMKPLVWTRELLCLKAEIEAMVSAQFNSVLVNLYRNGEDSNGWHSDDEKELGENPTIASLSLGSNRVFQFKHKLTGEKAEILLEGGSLLVMKGELQKNWKHQIPKRKNVVAPRINLTFRKILF